MGLELHQFNGTNLNSVNKVIKVLSYLNQGRELELGNYTLRIGETLKEGFALLMKVRATNSKGLDREEWLGFNASMEVFSEMCNELTDKELTIMAANTALQKINER